MYHVSVRNLYIGKSNIDFKVYGSIDGFRLKEPASIDPTTLVGELFTTCIEYGSADFILKNGYWDGKSFLINPCRTKLYTMLVTGIPTKEDKHLFLEPEAIYSTTYTDNHRTYLFQILEQ